MASQLLCWPFALRRSGVDLSAIPLLPYVQVLGRQGQSKSRLRPSLVSAYFCLEARAPSSPWPHLLAHQEGEREIAINPPIYTRRQCVSCARKKHRKGAVRGEGTQPQTLRGQFIFCRHGLGTVGDAVCQLGSSQDSTAWPLFLTSAFLLHLRGPFP